MTSPSVDDPAVWLVALAAVPGIGPATLLALHRHDVAGDAWVWVQRAEVGRHPALAEAAARLERSDAAARPSGPRGAARMAAFARSLDPHQFLDRHLASGLAVLVEGRADFPRALAPDPAPPAALFVRGDPAVLERPSVAIVGTRNATRLGCDVAAQLSSDLSARGICVVSGLALGIDGAAHRALVDRPEDQPPGRGLPIGVVATGLDRAYPRRHAGLQAAVAGTGALVTEVPLGGGPTAWRFPARNRIIAALADAVVVVESRSAGGSMLTAAEAVARDRPLLAVPGHPTSPGAAGPLDLIADGAVPVRDVDDVLVAIGRGGAAPLVGATVAAPAVGDHPLVLDAASREVLDALVSGPATLGQLASRVRWPLERLTRALDQLEGAGRIVRTGMWIELGLAGRAAGEGR